MLGVLTSSVLEKARTGGCGRNIMNQRQRPVLRAQRAGPSGSNKERKAVEAGALEQALRLQET